MAEQLGMECVPSKHLIQILNQVTNLTASQLLHLQMHLHPHHLRQMMQLMYADVKASLPQMP